MRIFSLFLILLTMFNGAFFAIMCAEIYSELPKIDWPFIVFFLCAVLLLMYQTVTCWFSFIKIVEEEKEHG